MTDTEYYKKMYEENWEEEPGYPVVYNHCLKYRKKDDLVAMIEQLDKAVRFYKKKLDSINGTCWGYRETFYTCQENWEKSFDELNDWENNLYWSGYLDCADDIRDEYFGGII